MTKKSYKKDDDKSDIRTRLAEPLVAYNASTGTSFDPLEMIKSTRAGIEMSTILGLSKKLLLTTTELSKILHISLRTLQRYSSSTVLNSDISSKALQLEKLHNFGFDVFGDSTSFGEWLHIKVPALGGERPLDYLDTPFGFLLIEQMLGRIEHGIFA
ncbi:MAG: antitoxin Xre/MbcA/ParS toxin-binding domain-containing protein [Saprospiraceae bacterium]